MKVDGVDVLYVMADIGERVELDWVYLSPSERRIEQPRKEAVGTEITSLNRSLWYKPVKDDQTESPQPTNNRQKDLPDAPMLVWTSSDGNVRAIVQRGTDVCVERKEEHIDALGAKSYHWVRYAAQEYTKAKALYDLFCDAGCNAK
jgi:hypothetical protein